MNTIRDQVANHWNWLSPKARRAAMADRQRLMPWPTWAELTPEEQARVVCRSEQVFDTGRWDS